MIMDADTRSWFESMLAAQFRHGHRHAPTAAQQGVSDLRHAAEDGSRDAQLVLDALAYAGWTQEFLRYGKRPRVSIAHNGTVVALPTVYAIPRRRMDGSPGAAQLALWQDVSWNEFAVMHEAHEAAVSKLTAKVIAERWVLSLREQYPASKTPREAFELAGIDPEQIVI